MNHLIYQINDVSIYVAENNKNNICMGILRGRKPHNCKQSHVTCSQTRGAKKYLNAAYSSSPFLFSYFSERII